MAKSWHLVGLSLAGAVFAVGISGGVAWGQSLTDPSTLHIGGGSSCTSGPDGSTACPFFYNNTEALALSSGEFDINLNGYGSSNTSGSSFSDPILAIFGVPSPGNLPTSTLVTSASLGGASVSWTAASSTNTPPTTWGTPWTLPSGSSFSATIPGLFINSTTGNAIQLTKGSAYSVLNLPGNPDSSNNFSNWSDADKLLNLSPTAFSLLVYEFSPGSFSSTNNDLVVKFSDLPLGSFVFAYGQDSGTAYSTAFTNTGIYTAGQTTTSGNNGANVPEPPAVTLLAAGLLGLAAARWWGKQRRRSFSPRV